MKQSFRSISRRELFGAAFGGLTIVNRLFGAGSSAPWSGPAVVRKVFLGIPRPTWPRPDLDVEREKADMEAILAGAERSNQEDVRFVGGDLVRTPEDAEKFVKSVGSEDGVLVVDLTSGTGPLLGPMRDLTVPMLLYARPYSGWSYVDVARWAQTGKRAELVSTSEPGDLAPYLRMFRTIHHMRNSKVIALTPGEGPNPAAEAFTKKFGVAFAFPGYGALKEIYAGCDTAKAQKEAEEFARDALRVVEPKPRDITDSMRLFHAVVKLLEQEKANAITIDCLGGFRRGDLPAYPCVAWSKLNDAGLYGVCEGDIPSTMTQLLLTSFSRKPGFVSDPVFDTSRNEVIHAHCVSATRLQGISGQASPYVIRTHMEDNKGVSLQVLVPTLETITAGKFIEPGVFAVSTGEVIDNVDNPRGCRTKFRVRVGDARKMLEGFTGGLHRVIVYGDYLRPVEQMGRLMGFKVVREC